MEEIWHLGASVGWSQSTFGFLFHPLLFYCILPHVPQFPGNNIVNGRDGRTGLLSRLGKGLLSLFISARGDIRKKKALLRGILEIEDKERMTEKLQRELRGASAIVSASSWLRSVNTSVAAQVGSFFSLNREKNCFPHSKKYNHHRRVHKCSQASKWKSWNRSGSANLLLWII